MIKTISVLFRSLPNSYALCMRKLFLTCAVFFLTFFPQELKALDELDIYLAGYISNSFPSDRDALLNGERIQGTSIGRGLGGGIKVGLCFLISRNDWWVLN